MTYYDNFLFICCSSDCDWSPCDSDFACYVRAALYKCWATIHYKTILMVLPCCPLQSGIRDLNGIYDENGTIPEVYLDSPDSRQIRANNTADQVANQQAAISAWQWPRGSRFDDVAMLTSASAWRIIFALYCLVTEPYSIRWSYQNWNALPAFFSILLV